jgi:hypothetical protein
LLVCISAFGLIFCFPGFFQAGYRPQDAERMQGCDVQEQCWNLKGLK